jgi:protein gp37
MAQGSRIEWTEATWNPVAGCTPVSAGCLNCYAARMALRLERMGGTVSRKYEGTARKVGGGRPTFTGRVNLDRIALDLPRRWARSRTIFVNSMSDLFHEAIPTAFVQQVFRVMAECPHHTFQVLTKRPHRAEAMAALLPWAPNIWLGTSVEDARVLRRVTTLRRVPAAVRFLSCGPLIGPLDGLTLEGIQWVIVGGESGPGARPMKEEWVIDVKELCESAGAAFFFKQWGGVNKKASGRELRGREWNDMPVAASVM